MTELASAVVSIRRTARGRYFWAAWWSHAPRYSPFQRPDASDGGAATRAEALEHATRAAEGRHLSQVESYWAHAVNRMLRGERPPPPPAPRPTAQDAEAAERSARPRSSAQILGVEKGATLAELKRAFRERALATHPDRGGDADEFRAVQNAYQRLVKKRRHGRVAR